MNAINEWQSKTCVRFTPRQYYDTAYVEITPNDGTNSYCYSHVGRTGGKQLMKMYGECMRPAAMIHEFGHLIGFNHEHQRPDRSDYITVHYNNIHPCKLIMIDVIRRDVAMNFEKISKLKFRLFYTAFHYAFDQFDRRTVDGLQTPYDVYSVMQYPYFAFAKSNDQNRPSMTLRDGSISAIQRETEHLSQIDILKTQLYFNYCL